MSRRLAILIALTEHMKGLKPSNGYVNDLSQPGRVIRGRNLIGEEARSNGPLLSFLEAPRPDVASYAGSWEEMRKDAWTLLLQGIVEDDIENPTDPAHVLADEVERHLSRMIASKSSGSPKYPEEFLLGGLITELQIAPPVVRPPEKGISAAAFFFLPVRVGVAVQTGAVFVAP